MSAAEESLMRGRLRRLDFARIRFDLEIREPLRWDLPQALALRPLLQQAAARAFRGASGRRKLASLFTPPLSDEPEAVRRFQKPAPPFNVHLPAHWPVFLSTHDRFGLEVNFWGQGTDMVGDFAALLAVLGESGLMAGGGRFEPGGLWSADAAGQWHPLDDSPIILDTGWWLDGSGVSDDVLAFSLSPPARLLTASKPLSAPDFRRLFPFVLRRVSAMAHAHCALEVVDHPRLPLAAAEACPVPRDELAWRDLQVGAFPRRRPLGGVIGEIAVDCREHPLVGDLLRIATLMNLGRGAAYGAGGLRMIGTAKSG